MQGNNISSTYRGYRLQALYTVFRILNLNNDEYSFIPEGIEDLSLYDNNNLLKEIVQVKSYTSNLTLSSLEPQKKNSFLYRSLNILKSHPNVKVILVSFGSAGSELRKAIKDTGPMRDLIIEKISNYGHAEKESVNNLLEVMELVELGEKYLEEQVITLFTPSFIGIDPYISLEILCYWMYICAENRKRISRKLLIEKINRIGKYLSERNSFYDEWKSTIWSIDDIDLSRDEIIELRDQYYKGIGANYKHILADLDVKRDEKLSAIHSSYNNRNRIVIIHGASGQGKSTLAFRYIKDYYPNYWRYQIKTISNKIHALKIAKALMGHADAINIPMIVYIDVPPTEIDWPDLVKELAYKRNIRILVTIREEDWRRSNVNTVNFNYVDIELSFNRGEAEEIYNELVKYQLSDTYISFDDAWIKYGEKGPLLEFVYLVTQGGKLKERLQLQIKNIKDMVRRGYLTENDYKFLVLVSVASAYEARISLKTIVKYLNLVEPQSTISLYEKEYLMRLSEDGKDICGLHQIRSRIVVELVTDPVVAPWINYANECIGLIVSEDIELFLLNSFIENRKYRVSMIDTILKYNPDNWTGVGGIIRSLIWLGVDEYVDENKLVIQEAIEDAGSGWWLVLDSDIANIGSNLTNRFDELVKQMSGEDRLNYVKEIRSKQSDKDVAFKYATEWMRMHNDLHIEPVAVNDWNNLSEYLFWRKKLNITNKNENIIKIETISNAIDILPLDAIGNLMLGLYYGDQIFYHKVNKKYRSKLIKKYCEETNSVVFNESGNKIEIHFVIKFNDLNEPGSLKEIKNIEPNDEVNIQTVQYLNLLWRLFPDKLSFSSKGYGHRYLLSSIIPGLKDYDSSVKNLNNDMFIPKWVSMINGLFRSRAQYKFRPENWADYYENLKSNIKNYTSLYLYIIDMLKIYYRKNSYDDLGPSLNNNYLYDITLKSISSDLLLPKVAISEYAYVDESSSIEYLKNAANLFHNMIFIKYRKLYSRLNKYNSYLSNYLKQSIHTLAINAIKGRKKKDKELYLNLSNSLGYKNEFIKLSIINLFEVVKISNELKNEIEGVFSDYIDNRNDQQVFKMFIETSYDLLFVWYYFTHHPSKIIHDIIRETRFKISGSKNKFKSIILNRMRKQPINSNDAKLVEFNDNMYNKKELFLIVDYNNLIDHYNSVEHIVGLVRRAYKKMDNTGMKDYIIDLYYPSLIIIPTIEGKLLSNTALEMHSISIKKTNENRIMSSIDYMPKEISNYTLSKLDLEIWTHERITIINDFMASFMSLYLIFLHIKDFKEIPAMEDDGTRVMQEYINQISTQISEYLQGVYDSILQLTSYYNGLDKEEKSKRPYLNNMATELAQFGDSIFINKNGSGILSISMNELFNIIDDIEKCTEQVNAIYVYWVQDVIENDRKD